MWELCTISRKVVADAARGGRHKTALPQVFAIQRSPELLGRTMPKLKAETLAGFILCHSLALLAMAPWFFSWTGVFLLLLGILLTGVLGLNVGFHRLLTTGASNARFGLNIRWPCWAPVRCSSRQPIGWRCIADITISPTRKMTRTRQTRAFFGRISVG